MHYKLKFRNGIHISVILLCVQLSLALSEGPSQPEACQFEPVDVTDLVNLSTGDLAYSVPLLEVPGPEGGYPLSLSYHSGIGPNQEATWVGLGWSLNPGSINRIMNGYPDEARGDYVYTYKLSDWITGHAINFGISIGPIGLDLNWDSNRGCSSVGRFELPIDLGHGFSVSPSINTNGEYSVGFNYQPDCFINNFGFNINSNGAWQSNVGNEYIGLSLASSGMNGINFAGAGITVSNNIAFDSKSSTQGFTIPIPFIDAFISAAWTNYSWRLDCKYYERCYGYINQQSYFQDNTLGIKKYESVEHGGFLYPSNDLFVANAQGISGSFMPYVPEAFELYEGTDPIDNGILKLQDGSFGPYNMGNTSNATFRFTNDPGSNYITTDEVNNYVGWGNDYKQLYENKSSKKIVADYDNQTGRITGFTITDNDGKIYEYKQPVYNYSQYIWAKTYSGANPQCAIGFNEPYVCNWLITAIKGSDYVDRGSAGFDNQDWGYWVKFNYSKESQLQFWRSPYEVGYGTYDEAPVGVNIFSNDWMDNQEKRSYSVGARDVVYLSSIETATHIANFNSSIAKDRYVTSKIENLGVAAYTFDEDYWFYFKGKWDDAISLIPGNTVILNFQNHYSNQGYDCGIGRENTYKDITKDMCSVDYDATIDVTKIKLNTLPADFTQKTIYCDDSQSYTGKLKDSYAVLNIKAIFPFKSQWATYTTAKKLDKIELFNKNDLTTNLKSIQFNYDYSLCQGTPTSQITSTNLTGGKLTLNSIQFYGLNNGVSLPPYMFYYGNNPRYNPHDWDNWGNYRDPGAGDDINNNWHNSICNNNNPADQTMADNVASWCLNRIVTPLGGEINIEYESDDYYYVSDTYNFDDVTCYYPNISFFLNGSYDHIDLNNWHVGYNAGYTPPPEYNFTKGTTIFIISTEQGSFFEKFVKRTVIDIINGKTLVLDSPVPFYPGHQGIIVYAPSHFGGGVRVKSLKTKASTLLSVDKEYQTRYSYTTKDENGYDISSGVTPTLPRQYGQAKVMGFLPYDNTRSYEEFPLINKYLIYNPDHSYNYSIPIPQVIYSKVTASNYVRYIDNWDVKEKGSLNGKIEYEFYTAKDYPFTASENNKLLTINDYSNIYGQVKSVAYYEQFNQSDFRKIKDEINVYSRSNEQDNNKRFMVLNKGILIENSQNTKPLGLIQEKYMFNNAASPKQLWVDKNVINFYITKKLITEYKYSSPTVSNSSGNIPLTIRSFAFDARTGQVIATATDNGQLDKVNISQTVPAYWKSQYSGMEDKNMLTQIFQTTNYLTGWDISMDNFVNYSFPAQDITSSSITTWSNKWKLTNDDNYGIWRKNDTYIYNRKFDYKDFLADSLNPDYMYDGYPNSTSTFPWEKTSNITLYDRYSRPIEESYKNSTYGSVLYGYNEMMPVATISNARINKSDVGAEASYLGFESGGKVTGDNDYWGIYSDPGNIVTSDDSHTGDWSCKIMGGSPSFGPTRDFLPPDLDGQKRIYKFSFWVKTEPGFTSGALMIHSKHNTDADNSAYPSNVPGNYISINITDTQGKWKYIEGTLNLGKIRSLGNIANNELLRIRCYPMNTSDKYMLVDDIRFSPVDANITSYSYYNITLKLRSITDKNNITTYYLYDAAGKLTFVKDQDQRILKNIKYSY